MRTRVLIGTAGVLLAGFGAFRLVTQVPLGKLVVLALWLVGAIVLHDGVIAPLTASLGWAIGRTVSPRPRRYLQFGLIVGALVTVIAIPLIMREGTQPVVKALDNQPYGHHLTWLLAGIAAVSLAGYALQVAQDGRRRHPAEDADEV